MSNKNKGGKSQQKSKQQPKKLAVEAIPVTKEDVMSASTKTEFEKNKEKYISAFNKEITEIKNSKSEIETSYKNAEAELDKINDKIKNLDNDKAILQKLQEDVETAKEEKEKAETEATRIRSDAKEEKEKAETEATRIRSDAEAKKAAAEAEAKRILDIAKNEAERIRSNAENDAKTALQKERDEINSKENELRKEQRDIEDTNREIEWQLEDIDAEQKQIEKMKEKYKTASPYIVKGLQRDLDESNGLYEDLQQRYKEQAAKFYKVQTMMDSIKTEIEDIGEVEKCPTIGALINSLKEIKGKYDSLLSIHSRYPDESTISDIEDKANKYENLEVAYKAMGIDRDRYKSELDATQRSNRNLEVIKQEVDATNALNEHLLKELEGHKTALESRTGDTCPALTKVDIECEEDTFKKDVEERKARTQLSTLPEVVSHVRDYAGSRVKAEELFYDENDIRAFIAGMAVSRLIILQGMSGTGKSSLPRIFAEAISGYNRLIPVESSWRDKNELLGYYNDFNKKFNAKTFTIELYRSGKERCINIPTFMVLDEMNLARIEYYFSDFLSILQETDDKKWLIELVASDMRTLPMELPKDVKEKMEKEDASIYATWEKIEKSRKGDLSVEATDDEKTELTAYLAKLEKLTGAKDLVDGRKVKVTKNIWFVGTANKDESTFEITDKVYDRAQVVSLNAKGKNDGNYKSKSKMFISVSKLVDLFKNAIENNKNKEDIQRRLDEIDNFMIENFDTSFGNRIEKQTMDFVAVFVAAGGKLADAMDYQISTKILRKLITSDDSAALIEFLEITKEYKETTRLINKRLKELK